MAKRKTTPKKKGAVATKDANTEVATLNIDSFLEQNAGDGSQNIGSNDLELPRLKLYHGNAKDAPDEISKAEIYHNISQKVWKKSEGIRIIPCAFIKQYTHWKEVEKGGGFLGAYDSSSDILTKTKKVESKDVYIENGELTDTYIRTDGNFFVLFEDEEGIWKPAQISMFSTNFKKAKLLNTMIKSQVMEGKNGPFTPPAYAYIYRLKGELVKKDAMSWAVWDISLEEPVKDVEVLQDAKVFSQSVTKGDVVVKPEVEVAETNSDNEDSGMI
jgi:hypothetical protein